MGSIIEFNRKAALGRDAADQYCTVWRRELETRGKDLAEQLKAKSIDARMYNIKRSNLNNDIKDFNNCYAKVKK